MELLTENQSNIRHIDKQKPDKPEAFYALLHKLTLSFPPLRIK